MSDPADGSAHRAGPTGAPEEQHAGVLLLVRHGRTPWSATGRHTGLADIALDEVGEAQARALGATVRALRGASGPRGGAAAGPGGPEGGDTDADTDAGPGPAPALVLTSPLQRAHRTALLAGLDAWGPVATDPQLVEWDYGPYEGLTTPEIRARRGDDWRALRDGVTDPLPDDEPADDEPADAPRAAPASTGESLEHLAARARDVLDRVRPALARGDVILVGHGHALRVLAATWLDLPAHAADRLQLEAAAVSVLAHEHGVPGLRRWNIGPTVLAPA